MKFAHPSSHTRESEIKKRRIMNKINGKRERENLAKKALERRIFLSSIVTIEKLRSKIVCVRKIILRTFPEKKRIFTFFLIA